MNEKLSQRRKAQAKTRLLKQLDAEEGCVENTYADEMEEFELYDGLTHLNRCVVEIPRKRLYDEALNELVMKMRKLG